jgi:hypothetical protein
MLLTDLLDKKKELTAKVGHLSVKLKNENSVIKGNTRSINPTDALAELNTVLQELKEVKVAIQKANADAYTLIFEYDMLTEKRRILGLIKTIDGTRTVDKKLIEMEAVIKQADIDKEIEEIDKSLKSIKNKLTEHNQKTVLV